MRRAELEIKSPEAWHLLAEVFNEMFDCMMYDDGYGVQKVTFVGITEEGKQYLVKKDVRHYDLKNIGLG